jgi:hypothetical protein
VSHKPGPATVEERAELRALREQADTDGRDLGDTVAALAARLAAEASPQAWARHGLTAARTAAAQVSRRAVGTLTLPVGRSRVRLAAAAGAASVLVIVAAAAMLRQRRRS